MEYKCAFPPTKGWLYSTTNNVSASSSWGGNDTSGHNIKREAVRLRSSAGSMMVVRFSTSSGSLILCVRVFIIKFCFVQDVTANGMWLPSLGLPACRSDCLFLLPFRWLGARRGIILGAMINKWLSLLMGRNFIDYFLWINGSFVDFKAQRFRRILHNSPECSESRSSQIIHLERRWQEQSVEIGRNNIRQVDRYGGRQFQFRLTTHRMIENGMCLQQYYFGNWSSHVSLSDWLRVRLGDGGDLKLNGGVRREGCTVWSISNNVDSCKFRATDNKAPTDGSEKVTVTINYWRIHPRLMSFPVEDGRVESLNPQHRQTNKRPEENSDRSSIRYSIAEHFPYFLSTSSASSWWTSTLSIGPLRNGG